MIVSDSHIRACGLSVTTKTQKRISLSFDPTLIEFTRLLWVHLRTTIDYCIHMRLHLAVGRLGTVFARSVTETLELIMGDCACESYPADDG